MRVQVAEFDLQNPAHIWDLDGYTQASILIRSGLRPLGLITINVVGQAVLNARDVLARAETTFGTLAQESEPDALRAWPPITVVICTRNRPYCLSRCLKSLSGLRYEHFEVIVVDNAPAGSETANVVRATSFRYIREDTPGLNWARNRGLDEATHDIVAFIDDDATVDASWLHGVARGFHDLRVGLVTGLVLPAELDTEPERIFEMFRGTQDRFQRRRLDGSTMSAYEKLASYKAGVGANMALRRSSLRETGVFDTALDVGTPSHGAGDIDMFHRVLTAGFSIAYEPSALIWHYHRRQWHALLRQTRDNGRSFGVYLLKAIQSGKLPRSTVLRYTFAEWAWGALLRPAIWPLNPALPRMLAVAECVGGLTAPWAYIRTYREDARRRSLRHENR